MLARRRSVNTGTLRAAHAARSILRVMKPIPGVGNGNLMTADLSDALRSQIYRCWSPPTGAPVETLPELLAYCRMLEVTLREFMAMPNARAMPADLRAAAERELAL